ncbi:hypothetical protein ACVWXF_000454 [Thermostichus sp. MS-CIW-40]|jgi:hypothetical protein
MTTPQQASAQDTFKEAFENRYTWDKDFPGYRAELTYFPKEDEGNVSFSGVVSIDRHMKIDVTGIEDEAIRQKVREQIWEIMVHRVRHSFDEEHGGHTFDYGEAPAPDVVEVLVAGPSATDRYWVKDKHIQMVHRHFTNRAVRILVQEFDDTGEGYLPTHYTAEYHSLESGEKLGAKLTYEDRYQKVGRYWLLVERRIWEEQGGEKSSSPNLFRFSKLQLLDT